MINTNGGFMKQYNGNKRQWLLCAALILALGSQSYFQVASNKISSIIGRNYDTNQWLKHTNLLILRMNYFIINSLRQRTLAHDNSLILGKETESLFLIPSLFTEVKHETQKTK